MPNGQAHLMVNLAEDEFRTYGARPEQVFRNSGAVVAGARSKSIVIDTREQRWLAAVEFLPGGASRFFSMPMTELSNQVVPLQDLWRNDGMFLRERLLDARAPAAKFSIFEEVLLHHMRLEFDPAIQCAITSLRSGASLEQALSRLGLSARTLERRFSSQVGIPPKRFARVHRLQRILRAVRHCAKPDWCRLAAEHGYADQAHLIHDFRDLASITPSAYKPDSPSRNNHVPVAAL